MTERTSGDDPAGARRAFMASQVAALGPLDFLMVGIPQPPFDSVQVRREEDGSLVVEVSSRTEPAAFSPEQESALGALGFAPGQDSWKASEPPADPPAAVALVEGVLSDVLAVGEVVPLDLRHGSHRAEREALNKVVTMRRCIEPVLEAIAGGPAAQDGDGDYMVDLGRVRVFVAPRALPGRPPIIRVFAITNAGVNLTAELGLFLARLNFTLMFGRFSIDADHQAVWFDETLLGEHVTDEELRFTVEMVATTANEWDQKIAQTFGGRTREPAPAPAVTPSNKPGQGGYL
ncbi:MAG: YbjN domain-containing protein [Actinobacteria bacterium]|nr:YbjN domain-containing protein [Actinomycetota bacterium]